MRILNITTNDWSNFAYDNMKALHAAGANVMGFKLKKHIFKYDNELSVVREDQMSVIVETADIVQVFHSDLHIGSCAKLENKRVIVYHTGTAYRQQPEENNFLFNPLVDFCFTDQTEFMGLGAKGITYTSTAIDTDKIFPQKILSGKIKIGHFPSRTEDKGTAKVTEMLLECKKRFDKSDRFEIVVDTNLLGHEQNLKRMQGCDIYVELFSPEQRGKTYGCYGVTAFEAAAMGKIVVTQNLHPEVYEKEYGHTKLLYANTEERFYEVFNMLMNRSYAELMVTQSDVRDWLVEKHSYLSIGKKIISHLNKK